MFITENVLSFVSEVKAATESARSRVVKVREDMLYITTAFVLLITPLQVQGDIAAIMREGETQQQLLKELQARQS